MDLWQLLHSPRMREHSDACGTPSVPELARRQAEAHRWVESERSGHDVGPRAYLDWRRRYWRNFCRWRYLEHLLGHCRYREFDPTHFALLRGHTEWSVDAAMEFALHQVLRDDREQLEVLFQAPEHLPRPRLVAVLCLLNLNAARLAPPDWSIC